MDGLNTARGDFIPGGDGILSPGGASVPGEKSPVEGRKIKGGGNVPPHQRLLRRAAKNLSLSCFSSIVTGSI